MRVRKSLFILIQVVMFLVTACQPSPAGDAALSTLQAETIIEPTPAPPVTPFPTRPVYQPGELVDYVAKTGDTLPALAVHFNTTVAEIRSANTFIPENVTTMPPGMPMKIPIYYAPFWGSPYQIIPDGLFINGPAQVGFDTAAWISQHPGWLNGHTEFASGETRTAAQVIDLVARNFSISPRLFLALLEYQSGGLTQASVDPVHRSYPLGNTDPSHRGLYLQLVWAANELNNGYYGWRQGSLVTFDHLDERIDRPDPWQNAASVALQYYFSLFLDGNNYAHAIGPEGLAAVYQSQFGDPWAVDTSHIPGSLEQPAFILPFKAGNTWAYTGGPHTAWGNGLPYAALDLAPGLETGGCTPTDQWAMAVADGVVARSSLATVMLDLDGDGDERTGWVVMYFHMATEGRAATGTILKTGDPVGHPSCEGGRATGTHVHIARLYNGEWIPAGGVLAFNMEGWVADFGAVPYLGTLKKFSQTIRACTCSDAASHIQAGER
jgi:LasA protease